MNKTQKKNFRDTKLGKGLKALGEIAMDVLPVPDIRKYLDKDEDGKLTVTDLKSVKWFELAGAVGLMSFLIYFKIINLSDLITLIQTLLNP